MWSWGRWALGSTVRERHARQFTSHQKEKYICLEEPISLLELYNMINGEKIGLEPKVRDEGERIDEETWYWRYQVIKRRHRISSSVKPSSVRRDSECKDEVEERSRSFLRLHPFVSSLRNSELIATRETRTARLIGAGSTNSVPTSANRHAPRGALKALEMRRRPKRLALVRGLGEVTLQLRRRGV